ncbi:hypothetical protein [Streptomyces sp. NPDC001604]|uniref:hypothetical protein n=1 Tax=Streptomyces sp. NPDC001604 TaxID=3364593 RepID=UPI00368BA18D
MKTVKRSALALAALVCGATVAAGPAAQALEAPAQQPAAAALRASVPASQEAGGTTATSRVDKIKSFTCEGTHEQVKVWYRDYDNNRTMLREIYLKDGDGLKWVTADVYWRADGGKTTIQKFGMEARTFPDVYDYETKDVAIAKSRSPYAKVVIHTVFYDCKGYIDLN